MKESTSKRWLSGKTRQVLLRRALVKTMGYTDEDLDKPIVGIINTWAETNPGHYNFRELAEAVKRGVWAAGGFPLEVNTMSICEVFFDISSLIFRNLLSMTTEELIERHPFDGVVLMGSCDKNVPAQLMAAVSANKPAIYLPGGPMLPGNYRGESLACGTDSFKLWTKYLAGELKEEDLSNVEGCLYGSVGACPIMGTANSMQCATESLGLSLPGSAAAPAVSAEKFRIAEMTGRRIVGMIQENLRVRDIVTREALENCITVLMASGAGPFDNHKIRRRLILPVPHPADYHGGFHGGYDRRDHRPPAGTVLPSLRFLNKFGHIDGKPGSGNDHIRSRLDRFLYILRVFLRRNHDVKAQDPLRSDFSGLLKLRMDRFQIGFHGILLKIRTGKSDLRRRNDPDSSGLCRGSRKRGQADADSHASLDYRTNRLQFSNYKWSQSCLLSLHAALSLLLKPAEPFIPLLSQLVFIHRTPCL